MRQMIPRASASFSLPTYDRVKRQILQCVHLHLLKLHGTFLKSASKYVCYMLTSKFRIRGSAHVLPAPTHEWRLGFPVAQLEQRGTRLDGDQERERIWRTLSSKMRGSFFGPPPGKPLTSSEIQPPVESVENIPESYVYSLFTGQDSRW